MAVEVLEPIEPSPKRPIYAKVLRVNPAEFDPLNTAAALRYAAKQYGSMLTKEGKLFLNDFAKRIEMSFFD